MKVRDSCRTVEISVDELLAFIADKTGKSFDGYVLSEVYDTGDDSIKVEFALD